MDRGLEDIDGFKDVAKSLSHQQHRGKTDHSIFMKPYCQRFSPSMNRTQPQQQIFAGISEQKVVKQAQPKPKPTFSKETAHVNLGADLGQTNGIRESARNKSEARSGNIVFYVRIPQVHPSPTD
jgi:hypothetical protein